MEPKDLRYYQKKGLTLEEGERLFFCGTTPQYNPVTETIEVCSLDPKELRKALASLPSQDAAEERELFMRWVAVDPRLLQPTGVYGYLKTVARPEEAWLVGCFAPEDMPGALNLTRLSADSKKRLRDWGEDVHRLGASPEGCLAFMLGAHALMEPKDRGAPMDLAKIARVHASLCDLEIRLATATKDTPLARLYQLQQQYRNSAQWGLYEVEKDFTWSQCEDLLGAYQEIVESVQHLRGKKGVVPFSGVEGFIQKYEHTPFPLFSTESYEYHAILFRRGEEGLEKWLDYFTRKNISPVSRKADDLLFYWGDISPEEIPAWKKLGFEATPYFLWRHDMSLQNTLKTKKPLYIQDYAGILDSLGIPKKQGAAVFGYIKESGGLAAFEDCYKKFGIVQQLVKTGDARRSETNILAHVSTWGSLTPQERRRVFSVVGEDALWAEPHAVKSTLGVLGAKSFKQLNAHFNTAAVIKAAHRAFPYWQKEPYKREYVNTTLSLIQEKKIRNAVGLEDASRLFSIICAQDELPAPKEMFLNAWETLHKHKHTQRDRMMNHIPHWLRQGFSFNDALEWWDAGWDPGEAAAARKAKENHPTRYTVPEIIRSVALLKGFSGQGVGADAT